MNKNKPTCYVIAGPNGAGKTTFAMNYLPNIAGCRNFVNADLIAYGIAPLDSMAAQFQAGELFLKEIRKNIERQKDFAFETTLAGKTYQKLFKRLHQGGWRIVLFFLWIPDADFSRQRVRERVSQGGHDIPDETLYRRYPRIMYNFVYLYMPLCDRVLCYDNSNPEPAPVFEQKSGSEEIFNKELYERILRCADEYRETE